jgi:hypothetical protein
MKANLFWSKLVHFSNKGSPKVWAAYLIAKNSPNGSNSPSLVALVATSSRERIWSSKYFEESNLSVLFGFK